MHDKDKIVFDMAKLLKTRPGGLPYRCLFRRNIS